MVSLFKSEMHKYSSMIFVIILHAVIEGLDV